MGRTELKKAIEAPDNNKTWITQFNLLLVGIGILLAVLGVEPALVAAIGGVIGPLGNLLLRAANKKGWI